MVRTCRMPMTDSDLRPELEARHTLFFVGDAVNWQTVERQVERLGFGELYIVSAARAAQTGTTRIHVKPVAPAAA